MRSALSATLAIPFLCLCLGPLAAVDIDKLHEQVVALEAAHYRALHGLPTADEGREVLRLQLKEALLGKTVHCELLRYGGAWLPGKAWSTDSNDAVHQLRVEQASLDGDLSKGRIKATIVIDFASGAGWSDMVAEMRLGGFTKFPGRLQIDSRIFDGKLDGEYTLAFPPLPEDKDEAARIKRPQSPFPKDKTNFIGSWTSITEPLQPRRQQTPTHWQGESLAYRYRQARYLEILAERWYAGFRACQIVRQHGLPYPEALVAARNWAIERPDLRPKKQESTRSKPKTSAPKDDDDLGLGDIDAELDVLADDSGDKLDAKASKTANAQLAAIGERFGRMLWLVNAAEQTDSEPAAIQYGTLDPQDPQFGPWYGEASLSHDKKKGNLLPADAGKAGAQAWPSIAHWSVMGPFAPVAFAADTPGLPELIATKLDQYRIDKAGLKEGDNLKIGTLIGWQGLGIKQSFGYVVPPNWSSANRVYRKRPNAITGKHSGIEWSRVYAQAVVHAPKDIELWAAVGVCMRGKLWIGERQLWSSPAEADPKELEHVSLLKIPFSKGRNVLTLRCDVDYASPSFWLRLCTAGQPRPAAEAASHQAAIAKDRQGIARPATSGWRGDGTGSYQEESPLAWHYKSKTNVRWQTKLPYWSNATPALAGDRLFVGVEPDMLYCLSKDSGEILWQRRVSIIDTLPAGQREQGDRLRQAWWEARQARDAIDRSVIRPAKWIDKTRWYWDEPKGSGKNERENASAELIALLDQRDELQASLDPVAVQDELTKVLKQIEDYHKNNATPEQQAAEELVAAERKKRGEWLDFMGQFSRVKGLAGYWYDYDGWAFATPITDGQHVWWKNGMGVAACFDLEGEQHWLVKTGGGGSGSPTIPSPLLYEGKLIVKVPHFKTPKDRRSKGPMLRALDAETGKELWHTPGLGKSGWDASTPALVTLSNGSERMSVIVTGGGSIVRADDGQVLVQNLGVQVSDASIAIWGDHIYFCRPNLVAVRLIMQDRDTVGFKRLWSRRGQAASYGGVLVVDGLVYGVGGGGAPKGPGEDWATLTVWDALTGAVVKRLPIQRKGGNYWSLHAANKDHIYLIGGDGLFRSCGPKTPADLTVVTRGRHPRVVARNAIDRTYSAATFADGRMYLRGYEGVTCVEYTGDAGRLYEIKHIAKQQLDAIPVHKPVDGPVLQAKAARGFEKSQAPSTRLHPGVGPAAWAVAGPFAPGRLDQLLTAMGGPGARPLTGDKLSDGQQERSWGPWDNSVQKVPGIRPWQHDPKNFSLIHRARRVFDLSAFTRGQGKALVLLQAQMELSHRGPQEMILRWECTTPGVRAWIGGEEVQSGQRIRFTRGYTPVLLACEIDAPPAEGWRIMPCFWSSTDVASELQQWTDVVDAAKPALEAVVQAVPDSSEARRAKALLSQR